MSKIIVYVVAGLAIIYLLLMSIKWGALIMAFVAGFYTKHIFIIKKEELGKVMSKFSFKKS